VRRCYRCCCCACRALLLPAQSFDNVFLFVVCVISCDLLTQMAGGRDLKEFNARYKVWCAVVVHPQCCCAQTAAQHALLQGSTVCVLLHAPRAQHGV
jgi:hypothetical protein